MTSIDFHAHQPSPFFQAIALKRHGHSIGYCDLDCGKLHHWEHCRKCAEQRGTAEFLLQAEATILDATPAERRAYGIPGKAALRWARKVLGYAQPNRIDNPNDLPFE